MRVLHLIDAGGPQASPTTLALLEASLGRLAAVDQRVLLLGGQRFIQQARAAGISDFAHVGVPMGHAIAGWMAVSAAVKRMGVFDLIHCWSLGTLNWSSIALRSVPRFITLTGDPEPSVIRWLRVLTQHAQSRTILLPMSMAIHRTLLSGGLSAADAHVLLPALDFGKAVHSSRMATRASWGIDVDDDTVVVALLSDPPHRSDALEAIMTLLLVADSQEVPRAMRLLVHPEQHNRCRGQSIMTDLGHGERNLTDERLAQPWKILPACDLALAIGSGAGGLSLRWAMACNTPIVAEATYEISEVVEDRHSALLAPPRARYALANRLCQLMSDHQVSWQLRDTARHEAFSFFSRQRYCQSLQRVYEQVVAGSEIEVPPMEPTGGLRFTGRV